MNRKTFYILFITGLFFGIFGYYFFLKDDADIISPDTFKEILIDIHLGNAILNDKRIINTRNSYEATKYYNSILKKHNIDRSDLDSTISYYIQYPEVMKYIYEDILVYFNNMAIDMKGEDSLKIDTLNYIK